MESLKPKVAIVGAGNVGSTFAFSLMISGLAREIVLVDRSEQKASGECMDLNHGLSFTMPTRIYSCGYEGCKDADIVAITAGAKQKTGQTRLALAQDNARIFKEIVPHIMKYATNPLLLVVTNPVDILTYVTLKVSGLPSNRVIGSGTVLDTSRLRYLISEHCTVDPRNVHAYIIGEHGDSELPVWSLADIGGMPLKSYCPICNNKECSSKGELDNIFQKVKNAAYEIIEKKGATYYAIALALVRISEAILRNENSVLPVSTLINDYYGVSDICLSIPAIVNGSGVKHFLKLALSSEEQKEFISSASKMKGIINTIKI